jgi:hypothetical protein
MPDPLTDLAEKAKRATGSHWDVDWNALLFVLASDGSGAHIAKAGTPNDAAYISACSPERILALVEVAKAARAWVSEQGTHYDHENLLHALARLDELEGER